MENRSKDIVKDEIPVYGQYIVEEISNRLTQKYGRGYTKANILNAHVLSDISDFLKSSDIFAIIDLVHFTELFLIEDDFKRDFCATTKDGI